MKNRYHIILVILLVSSSKFIYSQTTTGNNLRPATPAFNGWDGNGNNPGSLNIRNDFTSCPTCSIDFFTATNQQASIDVNGNFTIGLTNSNNYFGIGISTPFLWHNGTTTNIYAGIGAGSSNVTGVNNTFIGTGTGTAVTTGHDNTFIGFEAGARWVLSAKGSRLSAM